MAQETKAHVVKSDSLSSIPQTPKGKERTNSQQLYGHNSTVCEDAKAHTHTHTL